MRELIDALLKETKELDKKLEESRELQRQFNYEIGAIQFVRQEFDRIFDAALRANNRALWEKSFKK